MANTSCVQYCSPDSPCFCIQTSSNSTSVVTPCSDLQGECCLRACNAILDCSDGVGPCGAAGTFDLTTLDHINDDCTGAIQYVLESHDSDFFSDVTLTKAGSLSWVTGGPESVGKYGTINYRITCQSDCDDCITLNSIGYVEIGVNDLCRNVVCDSPQICDACTGNCIDQAEVNVLLESGEEEINCEDGNC